MSNRNGQKNNGNVITLNAPLKERTMRDLLAYTDGQLSVTDPLEMNLLVAKEISRLTHLDISAYKRKADQWANEIKQGLREAELQFHKTPQDWKNDLAFFRLGYMCYYLDEKLKIRYRDDQKDLRAVLYTNPDDLFLNGVMDSRQGTCANMATLHVALAWRLHWPVSLACVGQHKICRYDDGKVTHNIEATKTGGGGFHSHPDDYYLKNYRLPGKAVECGSDLRALTPREMLGLFIGLRGRHFHNSGQSLLGETDYLLARSLFPRNRSLQFDQIMASIQNGMELFEDWERGHPVELASWLQEVVRVAPWKKHIQTQHQETSYANTSYQHTSVQQPSDQEYRYELSGRVPSARG
jgi:hypothetical protein